MLLKDEHTQREALIGDSHHTPPHSETSATDPSPSASPRVWGHQGALRLLPKRGREPPIQGVHLLAGVNLV